MKTLDKELWKTQRWALLLLLLTAFWADASQADAFISRITQTPATPVSVGTPVTYQVTVSYSDGGIDSNDDLGISINDGSSGTVTSQFTPQTSPTYCVEEGAIWCSSSYPGATIDTYDMTWTPSLGHHELTFSIRCLRTSNCVGNSFSVTTDVIDPQAPPVANAGTDQDILDVDNNGIESVTLNGSASTAPNNITNYEWFDSNQNPIANGQSPSVELGLGSHDLTLKVTDSMQNTSTDIVYIVVRSPDLLANAGPGQTVTDDDNNGTETITLDASGSSVPYGIAPYYEWYDSNDQLLAHVENPTLDLGVGTHLISLIISYSEFRSRSDVIITVQKAGASATHTANAGPDQNLTDFDNNGSETVTLDGSGSTDPNKNIVNYYWSEGQKYLGTGVNALVELGVGNHTLTLLTTDAMGITSTDEVIITVRTSTPPIADAGPDQNIAVASINEVGNVTLDGSGSTDLNNDIEAYLWYKKGSEGYTFLGEGEKFNTSLAVGTHTLKLEVWDFDDNYTSDQVDITVSVSTAPIANAGPDQTVIATNSDGTASVNLDASGTINPNNYIYTYEWHEHKNETYLGSGKTFTANLAEGTHTLTLEVWEGGASKPISTDMVIITVQKPTSSNSQSGIEILSGANQRLSRGGTSAPLSIRALGTDGQPLDGTTITWSVTPADAATLSSQSTKTDANGESINTVITSASRPAIAFKVTASIPDGASARFTINPIAGISGLTPAQRSVANALDNACPALQSLNNEVLTTQEESLLDTCDYLASATDQEIISSLQQFLPDEVAAQGRNSISLARIRNKNILLRLDALRGGATGPSYENVSISIQGEHLPSIVISELTKSKRGGAASADSSTIASPLGVFASGNISLGDTETTANEAGFDFETTGLTLGVDYRYSDQFVLGGAFNYLATNSDYISQSSTLDIDGYSLSLYGSYYQSNKVFVDGILSIGLNSYDSKRDITSGGIDHNLYGDTDGAEYALSIGGGYEFNNQNLTFVPQARINYLRVDVDSYDETSSSSGLTLSIADQEIESLIASISGNISLAYSTQYGVFIPYLSIEWEHEFQNDSRAIIARFVNDPTRTQFSVLTDDPDQDYFFLGLGVTAAMANGKSAFLYYEQMLDHADTTQYTITGGFRLEF